MVTLYGELDIDTEPAARVALSTAAKARPDVVLDLSQLTFADSSVLNLMLWARTAVRPGWLVRCPHSWTACSASRTWTFC